MTMEIGPYMNEDGDWWVPVVLASFQEARAEVVMCLDYDIPSEGTLVYVGKEWTDMDTEHEANAHSFEDEGVDCMIRAEFWHFRENRRY